MTHIVGMSDTTCRQNGSKGRPGTRPNASAPAGRRLLPPQLGDAGLTRDQLPALLRSGRVERVGRGLYRLADAEPTENYSIAMACARVPNSIVCLLSALRIHGIGTQSAGGSLARHPAQGAQAPTARAEAAHRALQRPGLDLRRAGDGVRRSAGPDHLARAHRGRLLPLRAPRRPGNGDGGAPGRPAPAQGDRRRAVARRRGPSVAPPERRTRREVDMSPDVAASVRAAC